MRSGVFVRSALLGVVVCVLSNPVTAGDDPPPAESATPGTAAEPAQPAARKSAETAGGGHKVIYVVTEDQKLFAWEGNELVYEFDVVTGRPGKETHAGVFNVFRKHKDYTSKTYGAEMPYTMFFTEDGKAIHGTGWATLRSYVHAYLTEHVGSMGCVGLTEENAEKMFAWAPIGTRIVVVEEETEE
jgi:lipoprotein-anchoring transpeptidase ErfK/SrfK